MAGKKMNDLEDELTIVLLIKDRPHFTFRWMSYLNQTSFPFKVLVADGGKDVSVPQKLSEIENYPNIHYEYIRYPYDQTRQIFTNKIVDVLSRVKTPFVAIGNDDDFFIVDGLKRSVQFLQKNQDYKSCRGQMVSFHLDTAIPQHITFKQPPLSQSLSDETAKSRVQDHFDSYDANYYDVHHTRDLKKYFEVLLRIEIGTGLLAELVTSFLPVAEGKVKREPYLYLLRQSAGSTSQHAKELKMYGDRFDRMLMDSWSKDFTGFVNEIAKTIVEQDNIGIYEARDFVKKGFRRHIAPFIMADLSKDVPSRPLIWRLISKLPKKNFLVHGLRELFQMNKKESRIYSIDHFANKNKETALINNFLMSCDS